jgi:hypothetical protein
MDPGTKYIIYITLKAVEDQLGEVAEKPLTTSRLNVFDFIIYPGSVNPSTKSELLFNKINIFWPT